jgi:hypothetical protein
MIEREQAWMYGLIFLNPNLSGSLLLPFSMSLAMLIFVLFFFSLLIVGCLSCILPVYLGCTHCPFNEFPLPI